MASKKRKPAERALPQPGDWLLCVYWDQVRPVAVQVVAARSRQGTTPLFTIQRSPCAACGREWHGWGNSSIDLDSRWFIGWGHEAVS